MRCTSFEHFLVGVGFLSYVHNKVYADADMTAAVDLKGAGAARYKVPGQSNARNVRPPFWITSLGSPRQGL